MRICRTAGVAIAGNAAPKIIYQETLFGYQGMQLIMRPQKVFTTAQKF
jgi:hypothetical protein